MRELPGADLAPVLAQTARVDRPDRAWPDAWLMRDGARVAVEATSLDCDAAALPRLRLDRVARRVMGELRAALSGAVPDGEALLLAVTAPVRQPSRTVAAILALPSEPGQAEREIHGNSVRLRRLRGVPRRMPKAIAFVHNPQPGPAGLFILAESLLRRLGAAADRKVAPGFGGERWLVLAGGEELPPATCRQILSQLGPLPEFSRILLALDGGRVATLQGS